MSWLSWPRVAAALVLICGFAAGAALTWNRWGDLIIDCGRELDTPKQLAAGKMLYRDVRYWYGPFAPYLNAVFYRIAGVQVQTLTTAGLVSAGLLVWMAYRICRMFCGRAASASGGLAIIFACVFCHYLNSNIYNFILPYSYPATYGAVVLVAGVLALLRHVRKEKGRDFWLACAALAITALCKLEILFAASVIHAVFLSLAIVKRRLKLLHLYGYLCAAAVVLSVYGFFYAQIGPRLWRDNLFIEGNVSVSDFLLTHSGLKDTSAALKEIGGCLVAYAACFGIMLVAAGARIISRGSRALLYLILLLCPAACAGIVVALGPFLVLRAAPFIMLAAFGYHVQQSLRNKTDSTNFSLCLLFAVGIACVVRIVFKAGTEHYGFYLMVPVMIGITVFWSRNVPRMASKIAPARGPAYACAVAILLALAGTHFVTSRQTASKCYGPRVQKVRTEFGCLPILDLYAGSVDRAVYDLATRAQGASVVVIPEGAAISFLAGAVNPLGVHTFLPGDFVGDFDDDGMLRRLSQASPDYIVLNSRDLSEYGMRVVGQDYGQKMIDWVMAHYEFVTGYRSPYDFRTVIYKRKP